MSNPSSPKPQPRPKPSLHFPPAATPTYESKPSNPPPIPPKPASSSTNVQDDSESPYSDVTVGAAQTSSKPNLPPVSPKPAPPKSEYASPPAPADNCREYSIPRSSSYGPQSPLSAVLKQAVAASVVRRSSSMDGDLHSMAAVSSHPLEKSALAAREVNPRPSTPVVVPSSPGPPSSPAPSNPRLSSSRSSWNNPASSQAPENSNDSQVMKTPQRQSMGGGKSLPLAAFVKERWQDMPLLIRVNTGYQGLVETDSVSAGDVFALYFLKQTELVEVKCSERTCHVPLNAAVQVRAVYQGDLSPYNITVPQLLSSSKPPLLIKAVCSYRCNSAGHSVEEDEVFVVDCTKTTTFSRYLKVYSVTLQVEKKLRSDCTASFTTNAAVYVSDVVKHLSSNFPFQAVFYFDQDSSLSDFLSSSEVTLIRHFSRSAIIASLRNDTNSGKSHIMEIPLDIDISVSEVPLDECGKKELCAQAQDVFDHFDSAEVEMMVETVSLVRKGKERCWCTLEVPPLLASCGKNQTETDEHDDDDDNHPVYEPVPDVLPDQKEAPNENSTYDSSSFVQLHALRRAVENMQSQTNTAEGLGRSAKVQVAQLRNEVAELKAAMATLEKGVAALAKRVESSTVVVGEVQQSLQSTDRLNKGQGNSTEQVPLENLDNDQMLGLLKSMGLDQYVETFRTERITGEVFVECNEAVLENELGISFKIHRIKLMRIIKEKKVPNLYGQYW